jgi:hypothetical protein
MLEGKKDGAYFLRPHPTNDTAKHVLSVVFRGKPTQHVIAKGSDGKITVNGKVYVEVETVDEVSWSAQSKERFTPLSTNVLHRQRSIIHVWLACS